MMAFYKSDQTINTPSMALLPSEFEQLISLDESSDFESSHQIINANHSRLHADASHRVDVSRLKAENTNRLHQKWDDIIARYSKIDDAKESDEIDLNTGEITIDNGHLRSFAEIKFQALSNVWTADDQFEKEQRKYKHAEKVRRRLRREEQNRLKAEGSFFKKNMKLLDCGKVALPDNILLLNLSPTKKQRIHPGLSRSSTIPPIKVGPKSLGFGLRLDTPKTSPSKPTLPSIPSSPTEDSLDSPTKARSWEVQNGKNRYADVSTAFAELINHANSITLVEDANEIIDQSEYDELFLFTDLTQHSSYAFYNCAFSGCRSNFESKASYRAHLLSRHLPELEQIGYPVHADVKHEYLIPGDSISRLNLHFPLEIYPLPDQPFFCRLGFEDKRCQRLFTDEDQLTKHKLQAPRFCSGRKQVFACPLLGCEFMTDVSYEDFVNHVNTHTDSRHIPRKLGEITRNIEEPADYFSDSSSSTIKLGPKSSELEDNNITAENGYELPTKQAVLFKIRSSLSSPAIYDDLPKLDILDHAVDIGFEAESPHADGYASIDEMFENATE